MVNPGTAIGGRFEVVCAIGTGGTSNVFRAIDRATGDSVAVKVLRDRSAHALARLGREAQLLARLDHPAIVRVLAAVLDDEQPYIVMEWLDGTDLSHALRGGSLPVPVALRMVRRVADALGYAHARGVVHRDVKPSNLHVPSGDLDAIKLLDFGIARWDEDATLTREGAKLGTPAYMAPEQIRDAGTVGPAADVFGLGCVLYECLTGTRAFLGDNLLATMARILMDDPPPPSSLIHDVPPAVDALVARMLVKEPRARLADGGALCEAIDQAAAGLVISPARRGLSSHEHRLLSVILVGSADDDDAITLPDDRWTPSTVDLFGDEFRVERLRGGALAASFRGRTSALDDVYRAAATALALHRRHPTLPIAIATGRSATTAVALGPVIDRAVELLARAQGSVRIDEATAGLLETRFAIGQDVDGLVLLDARAPLAIGRTVLGVATPFVGRTRDLGVLELMLDELVEQRVAQAAAIVGEPGMGKSRLAAELIARARVRMDLDVWLGEALLDDEQPYATISRCVRRAVHVRTDEPPDVTHRKIAVQARRLFGDDCDEHAAFLGELAGIRPAAASARMAAARRDLELMREQLIWVWDELVSASLARRALLIVIEDVHWADEPSLRIIARSVQRHREARLFVLALSRPEGLARIPAQLGRQLQTVTLQPLPRGAQELVIRAVLPALPDEACDVLVHHAGGNPYFLEELLRGRHLGAQAPDSVLAMLERRLDALSLSSRMVLRAAAVFGQRCSRRGVMALLADVSEDDLTRDLAALADAELLVALPRVSGHERELEFNHALARDAAYASLTPADRVLGHRLAAAFLEAEDQRHEPSVLALHHERGEQPACAAPWFLRAASQALAAGDALACLTHCERARAHGDADTRADACALQSAAHVLRAQHAEAARTAREGMGLVAAGSDRWCALGSELVRATTRMGRDANAAVDQLVTAGEVSPSPAWAQALAQVAYNLRAARQEARARTVLELLDRVLPPTIASEPRTSALIASARALVLQGDGGHDVARDLLDGARAYFDEIGDRPRAINTQANLAGTHLTLGQVTRALELADGALRAAQDREWTGIREYARSIAGLACGILGDHRRALALQTAALDALRSADYPRMYGKLYEDRARTRLLTGDLEGAERDAIAGGNLASAGTTDHARAHARLAQVLLARGRIAEALAMAAEALALRDRHGMMHDYEGDLVGLVHAEALHASGRLDEASAAITAAQARLMARVLGVRLEFRAGILALPEAARIVADFQAWT